MKKYLLLLSLLVTIFTSCKKETSESLIDNNSINIEKSLNPFLEDMQNGTKTSYTTSNITLSTGTWTFNNALIGTSTSDKKVGTKSARIQNSGKLTLLTDKLNGAGTITIKHASFGSDSPSSWQLWYSTNSGSSYIQVGSNITTTSTLSTLTFTLNIEGNIRVEIRKVSGGTSRINIDDISISDYGTSTPPPSGLLIKIIKLFHSTQLLVKLISRQLHQKLFGQVVFQLGQYH